MYFILHLQTCTFCIIAFHLTLTLFFYCLFAVQEQNLPQEILYTEEEISHNCDSNILIFEEFEFSDISQSQVATGKIVFVTCNITVAF